MTDSFKQFFKIFFFIFFIFVIFSSFLLDVLFGHITFYSSGVEKFLRIIIGFIVYFSPFLFFLYYGKTQKNKNLWRGLFLLACLYYLLIFFLIIYFVVTVNFFDLDFFLDNFDEAFFTVSSVLSGMKLFYLMASVVLFVLSFYVSIKYLKLKNVIVRNNFKFIFLLVLVFFIVGATAQFYLKYEKCVLLDFVSTFILKDDAVYKKYNLDYISTVDKYNTFNLDKFTYINKENLPDIYFIHLESVNGDLIDQSIINNFKDYSKENGVLFNNFYSNSIQTLRAQESILCALPPSMTGYFQYQFNAKNIICIPKILSNMGYKTLFFKSHSLKFSNTGKFMSDIGFSETHNSDIMKSDDVQHTWGYREDIFYKRVSDYIKNLNDQKKFVYIAVSTTNHYPFAVYDKNNEVPFKDSKLFTDRYKNTTYIQDQYLKTILEELKNDKKYKYVFLFSDHSWPINIHEDNLFNQSAGYRENFHIPFAFLTFGEGGDNKFDIGSLVKSSHNEVDFLKTMLDLLNIKTENDYLGNSFYCELLKDKKGCNVNSCSVSIQPYSDKYITFFYNNRHYIYNIKKQKAQYFDLSKDVNEKDSIDITQKEFLDFYEQCKNNM